VIRVKVCGITRVADALDAARAGANLIGMVLAPSPRRVSLPVAAEISDALARDFPEVERVGVFTNPTYDEIDAALASVRVTHLQIHGRVPVRTWDLPTIEAIALGSPADARCPEPAPWGLLVEPKVSGLAGGTGRLLRWDWVRPLLSRHPRLFVAGGLDAGAVTALLPLFTPYAVDASSRLEQAPGIKDPEKVRAFIDAVRRFERKENLNP
jgi:phosphoribosylanthranilate isomerase